MMKFKAWVLAASMAAIASVAFPGGAKADGCPDCQIKPKPSPKPSCEVTQDCDRPRRGSLYDKIYSRNPPYCGYLEKYRHSSPHWSEVYNRVGTFEDFFSEETSSDHPSGTSGNLGASTDSRRGSASYAGGGEMGGESALVLFVVILLWFGLRPGFSTKDSAK